MTCTELYKWMDDPSLLSKESLPELRQLIDDYPYFHVVRMLYLKNLAVLQDVRLEKELKKMSVFIPDRRLLYMLINEKPSSGGKKTEIIPPASEKNKTEVAMDVIKHISPQLATSDYANWLVQHTDDLPPEDGVDNRLKHQDLIDSFITTESNQLAQRLSASVAKKTPESKD